jgi:hypothetical protein
MPLSRDSEACIERIVDALPGFVPDRHVRTLKCVLAFGTLEGERVCVKTLHRAGAEPAWAWFLERESEVLAQLPRTIRAPRLRAVYDGLIVVDELPGEPLARVRRLEQPLAPAVLGSCLELADQIQELDLGQVHPPGEAITRTLRARLLEDPSAPLAWFHAGFERCVSLGVVSARQASFMHEALEAYPACRSCHGDFLPRNLILDPQQRVSACDWECAGLHARDWDRALLWANVAEPDRQRIEAVLSEAEAERVRAFRALAGFALAREIHFAGRAPQARRDELARRLGAILRVC